MPAMIQQVSTTEPATEIPGSEKQPYIVAEVPISQAESVPSVDDGSGTDSGVSSSPSSAPSLTGENGNKKTNILSLDKLSPDTGLGLGLNVELAELFAENVAAKIWKVAVRELEKENPPTSYPEYVTTSGPLANTYTMTEADFWTCGFFPGSLYALLERAMKYPSALPIPTALRPNFITQLAALSRDWAEPLHAMAKRTDTHDMSFIIQPALRMDWELTGNARSLESVLTAATSLASRFSEKVGAIRSWDDTENARYTFDNMEEDFLVIIDSMCNLDLLYYAGAHTGEQRLIDIATTHAHTVLKAIVRDDWSTYHLIDFDSKTGAIKQQLTNQGYRDWSTWSRGQAWAILGFAQTYTWTHDPVFLTAAISLADYFLTRLSQVAISGKYIHPYVPLWDFDAPAAPTPPRDSSAGMIAANGLLILHQTLLGAGRADDAVRFLAAVRRIVADTLELSLATKSAFVVPIAHPTAESGTYPTVIEVDDGRKEGEGVVVFDAILKNATANNNEFSYKIYSDHGLVYADYYFLELGNKLLRMGLL
ncbi:Uncharacterized protein BP5553_09534 [Venustampulla echinocandica]|uniref:Six-hairpin glycosidase n=1 Tax=Venustampulla echinocandica TaxID=2656787 RepID=A0A370TBA4_9HELO|nr:Uncharacterized protein BP5553_09534 [Venustampulla echinocandica]RDL31325.1 Uncharacterized protein BP5553_09534 [Venustampulla echinocandica]